MSDAYVYFFIAAADPASERVLSTRPATLEAIKGMGEPIMESQIVVDGSELDSNGFLAATAGNNSYAVNDISARIRSLELRAESRDREALKLDDAADGKEKYMLSLESRELRNQARRLRNQRIDLIADELGGRRDACEFIEFSTDPAAE